MPEPFGSRPPDPTITMRRGDGAEAKASQAYATGPGAPIPLASMPPAPYRNFTQWQGGRRIGIFRSWEETEPLVKDFKGAVHQTFRTLEGAKSWLHQQVQRYKRDLASAERWEERTRMDLSSTRPWQRTVSCRWTPHSLQRIL